MGKTKHSISAPKEGSVGDPSYEFQSRTFTLGFPSFADVTKALSLRQLRDGSAV